MEQIRSIGRDVRPMSVNWKPVLAFVLGFILFIMVCAGTDGVGCAAVGERGVRRV